MDNFDEGLHAANDIFSLTTLIDSSAAVQAAERMYARTTSGLRFFSELNRALPSARAAQTAAELEHMAEAESILD
jgi:hypothetical protein